MPSVVICAPDPLTDELHGTMLWRDGIERHLASRFQDAFAIAVAAHPDVVVIDSSLPDACRLVTDLRADIATRSVSIVVLARGPFEVLEVDFLEAGANAILRLPAGPDWDQRLGALLLVSTRRAIRLAVELQLEARAGDSIDAVIGTVVNLSETGMFVETDVSLSLGADLDFKIHLPDGAPAIVGCGQIVRQQDPHHSGVRFYGLEGSGPARVAMFIAR